MKANMAIMNSTFALYGISRVFQQKEKTVINKKTQWHTK